ncbi:DoxX family protein [Aurantibacter crassamenti]|nr:DoxX family protein [Aurantibacter crassamenti]MBM1107249.1 DoxX family protein [Aurantibacter crassamenti]
MKKDIGLGILRIGSAVLMLTHGIPKFSKLISGDLEFGDPIGLGAPVSLFLAVIGEFVCPIFVLIGYKTRWATIPILITMLVALIFVHFADPFGKMEKALVYLLIFTVILIMGPGKYSIDRK